MVRETEGLADGCVMTVDRAHPLKAGDGCRRRVESNGWSSMEPLMFSPMQLLSLFCHACPLPSWELMLSPQIALVVLAGVNGSWQAFCSPVFCRTLTHVLTVSSYFGGVHSGSGWPGW